MPSSARRPKIYCAGPLFNESERSEMTQIADAMNEAGFDVYLPHRDGMEFRLILEVLVERGWSQTTAAAFLHAAIFALDVYQVAIDCDAMVWNLNGRVPDEGAVSEASMAWSLGKPLVAFKEDVRTMIAGRDNPLLVGLVEFETVSRLEELGETVARAIANHTDEPLPVERMPSRLRQAVLDGRQLWDAMCESEAHLNDEMIANVVESLFSPGEERLI